MVEVAGPDGPRQVRVSSPQRAMWPHDGITKLDLAQYVVDVGPALIRVLGDRPVTLQRFPDGVEGEAFYNKNPPRGVPEWARTVPVTYPSGRSHPQLVIDETATAVWAVQAAHLLRELLTELGLTGWVKTSGNRGVHVFARIQPALEFLDVRHAAIGIGRELERRAPDLVTMAWWKEERGERVFVDFNQTNRDRTIASAYTPRPLPHAPVSTPVSWAELDDVDPAQLTVRTVPGLLERRGDPWDGMDEAVGSLDAALNLWRGGRQAGPREPAVPPGHPQKAR